MCRYDMNQSQTMIRISTYKYKIVQNVDYRMIGWRIVESKSQSYKHLTERVIL